MRDWMSTSNWRGLVISWQVQADMEKDSLNVIGGHFYTTPYSPKQEIPPIFSFNSILLSFLSQGFAVRGDPICLWSTTQTGGTIVLWSLWKHFKANLSCLSNVPDVPVYVCMSIYIVPVPIFESNFNQNMMTEIKSTNLKILYLQGSTNGGCIINEDERFSSPAGTW